MSHSVLEIDEPAVEEAKAADAIRTAIGAVAMHTHGEAVLSLSNERIGELIRAGVARLLPLTRAQSGVAPVKARPEKPGRDSLAKSRGRGPAHVAERATTASLATADAPKWEDIVNPERIRQGRQALVESGDLLTAAETRDALGVKRQSLSEAVTTGRMFTVDVGATTYYPAFYVRGEINRRLLESVTKLLGQLPGWSKWQFFTTASEYLNGKTPLEALARGQVDEVKRLAEGFLSR